MAKGFLYLAAIFGWFSRRFLGCRLSITMQSDFCIEAVEEAPPRFGSPEIFNTNQGDQFTSIGFTKVLLIRDIGISMDGKVSRRDTVFVERLWKSIKYEKVYLRAYDTIGHASTSIGQYIYWQTPTCEHGPGNTGPRLL